MGCCELLVDNRDEGGVGLAVRGRDRATETSV
jgi:hypothetical protein